VFGSGEGGGDMNIEDTGDTEEDGLAGAPGPDPGTVSG